MAEYLISFRRSNGAGGDIEFTEIIRENPAKWWRKNPQCVIFFAFPIPKEPERLIVEHPRRRPVLVHSEVARDERRKT